MAYGKTKILGRIVYLQHIWGKIYEIQETPPPIKKETPPFFRYVHIWKWWIPWVKDNKGTKDPKWDLFEVVSEDLIWVGSVWGFEGLTIWLVHFAIRNVIWSQRRQFCQLWRRQGSNFHISRWYCVTVSAIRLIHLSRAGAYFHVLAQHISPSIYGRHLCTKRVCFFENFPNIPCHKTGC